MNKSIDNSHKYTDTSGNFTFDEEKLQITVTGGTPSGTLQMFSESNKYIKSLDVVVYSFPSLYDFLTARKYLEYNLYVEKPYLQ